MKILNGNFESVFSRSQLTDQELVKSVREIVENVHTYQDKALFEYSLKFDNTDFTSTNIKVSQAEFENAYKQVDDSLLISLKKAIKNVYKYHTQYKRKSKLCAFKKTSYIVRPVESAGIYVPGGTASYPSSVIMGVLPAVAAGVKNISVITPAKNGYVHPLTLVAASECGIKNVYKVGGAQGIAALAFGTQSIPKVDIIAGPGNIYVSLAKKEVYGHVGIDMIAGPSEILVICDDGANAKFVAADLLSQAEHDALSAAYAICTNAQLAQEIASEVQVQLSKLSRKEIATKAIETNGAIMVVDNLDKAAQIANKIAPEHLELMVKNPKKLLPKITNAGAVFMGSYSPEPLGDYFAGPCHILPTSGSAKFFEVLNQDTFLKKISVINYKARQLNKCANHIVSLAQSEGLDAHANAIKVRQKENKV